VSEVLRHNEYPKILVLSLGTGITKIEQIFDAQTAATWFPWDWISPLLGVLPRLSSLITEYYLASLFSDIQPGTYLRIQVFLFIYW